MQLENPEIFCTDRQTLKCKIKTKTNSFYNRLRRGIRGQRTISSTKYIAKFVYINRTNGH